MLKEINELNDWFMFGIDIGLSQTAVKDIERQNNGNVKRCKAEVLDQWFKGVDGVRSEPSWHKLVEIVGGELVNEVTLAKKIATNFNIMYNPSN